MWTYADAELLSYKSSQSFFCRHINEEGLSLIKEYEGLSLKPYRCAAGVWTIGYGHTRTVYPGMGDITTGEAEQLLREDLESAERAVDNCVDVPLSDNQFSALVSFVFNVGRGNFKRSTLLRLLNRGWYEQVPAQLARWNKAGGEVLGGLARRRRAEADLWRKDECGGII